MEISEKLSGFLLVNKPHGWTSFDCVKLIRGILERGLRERGFTLKRLKVGHSGTLDPFATGLLIIGIGKGTSAMSRFSDFNKTYIADIGFGIESPTFDLDCSDLSVCTEPYDFQLEKIVSALNSFVGVQQQLPPQFSALKVNGKRAYELARKGIEVELKTREITVFPTDDDGGIDYVMDEVSEVSIGEEVCFVPVLSGVRYAVSKGTYIRSLVRDLGEKLGVPAVLIGLERINIYAPNFTDNVGEKSLFPVTCTSKSSAPSIEAGVSITTGISSTGAGLTVSQFVLKNGFFTLDQALMFSKETTFDEIIDAMREL
ncbi:MAG: tRNA pseudouridine(55) synthase TruB [Candidatus Peregrinibacteria bacterium]|nr:tRNA pseudouridine(55) synthase TruB [Candidatus Peregrinibacteria bacterium]